MNKKTRKYSTSFLLLLQIMLQGALNVSAQDSLLLAMESAEEDSVKIGLLIELGDQYSKADSNRLAGSYYREAIALASGDEMAVFRASALDKLGTLVRRTGLYDQSLEYHLQALALAENLNDKKLLAGIYNNIGVAYRRKSADNLALDYHLRALRTGEEINDSRIIAYASNSIGIIYTYQNNYTEALEYFNRALQLAEERNNTVGIAINLNCIAWVYELEESYDTAIEYYERSLSVNEKSGNLGGMAICYNDLGKLYRSMGDYRKSLEYYQKTLDINESKGDLMNVAINRINLGQVYADLGEYKRSMNELNSVLTLALQLGSKRLLMDCYEQMSKTQEMLGQYESSLQSMKKYALYRDSIYNEESSMQIAEFKILYDTEKKEKENILLAVEKNALDVKVKKQRLTVLAVSAFLLLFTALSVYLFVIRRKLLSSQEKIYMQNEQLIENEKKLSEMIATKDKFFKIIAHDLLNHFNGLLGYSDLLALTHRELDDDARESMINDISDISKNTYSLLENLLLWARSQTDNLPFAPKLLLLSELVDENISSVQSLVKTKGLKLNSKVGKDLHVYADKEMLNTVLRNLLMNALKFSNIGGEISVDAEADKDHIRISVRDQGVGISPEKLNILFDITQKTSTPGTGSEKGSGLGLVLCKEFIDLHGGSIHVESQEGVGSVFSFILAAKKPV